MLKVKRNPLISHMSRYEDNTLTAWDYIRRLDKLLLFSVLVCSIISVLSIYSIYISQVVEITYGSVIRQAISVLVGLLLCILIDVIDYHKIAKLWFLYVPIALILVGLTFTSLGYGRGDADDIAWIDLGFISIQPSEILKVAFLLSFSLHLSKVGNSINKFGNFVLLCLHGLIPIMIVALQGDYGTAIVFGIMFAFMMLFAGLSLMYIVPILTFIPIAIYFIWTYVLSSTHKERITVLFNPGSDPLGVEYQQNLGKVALAKGGLFGIGLFQDSYTFVPEMHNDFIFSFIGQSLGYIGCMVILILFTLICLKLLINAMTSKDALGKNICIGTFAMIFIHCIMNIGMVLGVMPVIGVPLPFMSAGGTAMISMFATMGLVCSTHSHKEKRRRMFYDIDDD